MSDTSGLPLPDELIFHILHFLEARDLSQLSLVCNQMQRCAGDDTLWKARCVRVFAQERGSGWLERLKPPGQLWGRFYRQLTGLDFLVIFSGVHLSGATAMDALESDLKSHGLPKVEMLNGGLALPAPSTLRKYAAVMVTSDNAFMRNNNVLGETMAQYVDDGYGVVLGGFVACGCPLTGRWGDGYDPIAPIQSGRTYNPTMEIVLPDHPVMANVRSLRGNPYGDTPYSPGHATANTTTIARWQFQGEEEGEMLHLKRTPLVVEKHGLNGKVITLNFTPTSSSLPAAKSWPHVGYEGDTDGAQLMVNALLYCALKP